MSLRKLYSFVLAATVAGFATVGTLNVQIKEYEVPTPRSRPHDPALAPDGSLWYTGQGANKLGRLDPKTGEFKEYPLKTPDSGPHGLVADKEGNIWFTAISAGYIGKLDPKTGEVAEFRPSEGASNRPTHTRIRSQWHSVVHQPRYQLHRAPRSENRQDDADQITYTTRCPLWRCGRAEQCALFLRIRYKQAGQHRPEHDENPRVHAAGGELAPAANRAST